MKLSEQELIKLYNLTLKDLVRISGKEKYRPKSMKKHVEEKLLIMLVYKIRKRMYTLERRKMKLEEGGVGG